MTEAHLYCQADLAILRGTFDIDVAVVDGTHINKVHITSWQRHFSHAKWRSRQLSVRYGYSQFTSTGCVSVILPGGTPAKYFLKVIQPAPRPFLGAIRLIATTLSSMQGSFKRLTIVDYLVREERERAGDALGEYTSIHLMNLLIPGIGPRPLGWDRYQKDPEPSLLKRSDEN